MSFSAPCVRPSQESLDALRKIGAATASATLSHLGIRNSHIQGPTPLVSGKCIVGPALTLQFMPRREDQFPTGEYEDPEHQLHRRVLYDVQEGDIVVVDARGDMHSGVFGEMMLTYFAGKGGAGMIIDGCIRDAQEAIKLDLGLWIRGTTPNFHMQTNIAPFAYNVPIACSDVLVFPGDLIIADDDGAVVIPINMVDKVIEDGSDHAEWEEFSRLKLAEGGDLRRYYPLHPDAHREYEDWKRECESI